MDLKVVIIQRILPHYRIPFFRMLNEVLVQQNIQFQLLYGQEKFGTVPKTVDVADEWATKIENRYIDLPFVGEVVWQPCWRYLQDADLVVVEQANRLLLNYPLKFLWPNSKRKVAYWGHGANFQSPNPDSLDNRLKRYLADKVDWWFAYTELSLRHIEKTGFPREKITVVQNCIDTTALEYAVGRTSSEDLQVLRLRLGLRSDRIGLYCGGLYADKRLDFLVEACDKLKEQVCDFECIVIGDGPERGKIVDAAASRDWLHYLGPIFDDERIPYFLMARALLMPGLVGLVIVDSFVTRVPLFTTDNKIHSPEIAYLDNAINGFMTDNNVSAYVKEVSKSLTDDAYWQVLRQGCAESAKKYSLNKMVQNYGDGIRRCLALN